MRNPPSSESIVLSNQAGKGTRNALSTIEAFKPIVASASILLAPSAFLTFIAMFGPSYFLAKIFELGGRQTVKYPGQPNSYVKDQSELGGAITGFVEYFAGIGFDRFKDVVNMVAEFVPSGERPNLEPDDVKKLYNGILCYNDKGEMVPAPNVAPFNFENLSAQSQNQNQPTKLHF